MGHTKLMFAQTWCMCCGLLTFDVDTYHILNQALWWLISVVEVFYELSLK